jgi:hypothetical protein
MILKEATYKIFIITLFVSLFFISTAASSDFSTESNDYFYEIAYIEDQIGAVSIEMYGYLGWFSDDKEAVKAGSADAIEELNEIEENLLSMYTPEEFKKITNLDVKVVNLLKRGYTDIESKSDETISQEAVEFQEALKGYQQAFNEALMEYKTWPELPEDHNPLDEELKAAGSKEEKLAYKKAIGLMDKRDFKAAYPILLNLKNKTDDSSFKDCILLKISDCLLMTDTNLDNIDPMETSKEGLAMLSDIVKKERYSPVVYESFYKWRTMDQYYNHGMSNMSLIPNKEYNEKKWQLIQMIKQHLKNNPDDIWAREQIDLLLVLPNITRGGTFGNNNLAHWAALYRPSDEY